MRPTIGKTGVALEPAMAASSPNDDRNGPMLLVVNSPLNWPRNCSPVTRNRMPSRVVGWL